MTNQTKQQEKSVLTNENIKIGLNFGFLGLGMGGTSIASACADIQTNIQNKRFPYTSLLINTNQIDLDKIEKINPNSTKLVIGDGRGAGRNIEIGEQRFKENKDKIREQVKRLFSNKDFVWLVAGLGGGTGTGSVIEAIKVLMQNGFTGKFGLILTLPRTAEGHTVLKNALRRLQMINKAMSGLGSIILVDNQKLYDHFAKTQPESSIAEYLAYSNRFIAETLHELNVVTSSFNPVGETHFDSSEFENLIKTSGVLHFARFTSKANEIDTSLSLTHSGKLKEHIEKGVLSDGYNLNNTTRLAISILANRVTAKRLFNFDFDQSIETEINSIAPLANEKPIAQYIYENTNTNDVYFYAAFAGLKLPERVKDIGTEIIRLEELQKQSTEEDTDMFAALNTTGNSPTITSENKSSLSFEDLFGNSQESEEENNEFNENVMDNFMKG